MAAVDDLDNFVMPADTDRESYRVLDDRHATSLVRRLRRLTADLTEVEALAAEERGRISRWLSDRTAGAQHDIEWLTGQLKGYMAALIEADPDGPKTLPLIGAQVKATQTGGLKSVVVSDPDAYASWAITNETFDRDTPITVPWETLAWVVDLLRKGGPLIPGDTGPAIAAKIVEELEVQMDEQLKAKLRPPRGVKALDPRQLRKGPQPAVDPGTGEVVPGVEVSQVGYNISVKLED